MMSFNILQRVNHILTHPPHTHTTHGQTHIFFLLSLSFLKKIFAESSVSYRSETKIKLLINKQLIFLKVGIQLGYFPLPPSLVPDTGIAKLNSAPPLDVWKACMTQSIYELPTEISADQQHRSFNPLRSTITQAAA